MKMKPLPPIDVLRQLFSYNPETGMITRLVKTNRSTIGSVAGGGVPKCGNRKIRIGNQLYLSARIAWKLHYGTDPVNLVFHVNGIKTDDRITNLSETSRAEAMRKTRSARAEAAVKMRAALEAFKRLVPAQ